MIENDYLTQDISLPVSGKESVPFSRIKFNSPSVKVLIHAIAWLLFFTLLMSFHLFSRGPAGETIIPLPILFKTGILYLLLIGLFYLNTYFAIPKLLFRRKIGLFIITLVISLISLLGIHYALSSYMGLERKLIRELEENMLRRPPADFPQDPPFNRLSMQQLAPRIIDPFAWLSAFIILGLSTSLTVIRKWFKDAENQKVLEKEHLSSELLLLKNQINPHFFFNTLNNIYALVETSPTDAQSAIYTLSRMMRYMLYETENSQVLLSKEINFIRNYIELMRIRVTDAVLVDFNYPTDVGNLTIAPLIFVSFIENSFKHGVSYNEESYVKVQLSIENQLLLFTVKNRILKTVKGPTIEGSGIGMANVQRRLQLLYPGRYQLKISTDNNEYIVQLLIQLT